MPARFALDQFQRLCEAVAAQRLELIDGEVLQLIAKGRRHTAVVHRLIAVIQMLLAENPPLPLQPRVQSPLDLGSSTEPEPDLGPRGPTRGQRLECTPDCAGRLHGGAGIPHDWLIDGQQPHLQGVHGEPQAAKPWLASLRDAVELLLRNLPRS